MRNLYLKINLFLTGTFIFSLAYSNDNYQSKLPTYIPASPTVSSLTTYADYPVSHYTGLPNISIPIYEINIDGYTLPISLSYHASGVKAAQEASWVGLGWSLSAGGVISRTVKCADDFLEYSTPDILYGYYNGPEVNDPYSESLYKTRLTLTGSEPVLIADSEPDIFSYSLPHESGKFLLDKSRGAALFNKSSNIKVEVLTEKNKKYFKLIAADGTEYLFKEYETTRLYGRSGSMNRNLNNATKYDEDVNNNTLWYSMNLKYTSSWFLSQITTPTKRIISFTYAKEIYVAPTQENCVKYNVLDFNGLGLCGPGTNAIYSCSKAIIENLRLSKITWDGGHIDFNCSSREDQVGETASMAPLKLHSLRVYNKKGACVKGYDFHYDYFNNYYKGSYEHVFKRLKLNKLSDVSDTNNQHQFTYNEGYLPAKNSKNTDFWGYYNGKSFESEYYCTVTYNGKSYKGADKASKFNYMKIASLQSITYPTGEKINLTYEANRYRVPYSSSGGAVLETQSLGFNVAKYHQDEVALDYPEYKIDTVKFDRTTTIKMWGWAENLPCRKDPDILYDHVDGFPSFKVSKVSKFGNETKIDFPIPGELETNCSYDFPVITYSLAPGTYIFEAFGKAKDVIFSFTVQYDKLVDHTNEIVEGGGLRIARLSGTHERIFEYSEGKLLIVPTLHYLSTNSCINDHTTTENTSYLVQVAECTIPMYTFQHGNSIGYSSVTESNKSYKTIYKFHNNRETSSSSHPFMPTDIDYENGLPISIEYYKGQKQLLKRINYEYGNLLSSTKIYGFIFNSSYIFPYNYLINTPYKVKETTVEYEDNNNIITEKRFEYNNYLQPISEIIRQSENTYQYKMLYPTDLSDPISREMVVKNQINKPIESILIKNDKVIKGKKLDYKKNGEMYVVEKESVLELTQPLDIKNYKNSYIQELSFAHYNENGKPMQVSNKYETIVYLWGYSGVYPVIEIKNCTYEKVQNVLGTSFINSLCNKAVPDINDMIKLNTLRDRYPNSFVTTFSYNPLVGVISVTDPRNVTTYYEYDSSNRLYESYSLKNGKKEILEHHDYHYYNK